MKQLVLFLFILFSNLNLLKAQDVVINPDDVSLDTVFNNFYDSPFNTTNNLSSKVFNNEIFDIELK